MVGGVVPLGSRSLSISIFPKSIKFLVLHRRAQAEVLRLARILRPDLTIPAETEFRIPPSRDEGGILPAQLFKDGLQWITPLIWFVFVASLMANFFSITGCRRCFARAAFDRSDLGHPGFLLHRRRARRACRQPSAGPLGHGGRGCSFRHRMSVCCCDRPANSVALEFTITVFMAGFSLLGIQLSLNAVSGLIYPTAIRSKGAGWMHGIGRFGAISAPLIGGWLITMQFSQQSLFFAPAVPLAIGAIAAVALASLCAARFQGYRLDRIRGDRSSPKGRCYRAALTSHRRACGAPVGE